jgi:hypothetical protein
MSPACFAHLGYVWPFRPVHALNSLNGSHGPASVLELQALEDALRHQADYQ